MSFEFDKIFIQKWKQSKNLHCHHKQHINFIFLNHGSTFVWKIKHIILIGDWLKI